MRTTINLDDELLAEARRITGRTYAVERYCLLSRVSTDSE